MTKVREFANFQLDSPCFNEDYRILDHQLQKSKWNGDYQRLSDAAAHVGPRLLSYNQPDSYGKWLDGEVGPFYHPRTYVQLRKADFNETWWTVDIFFP